MRPNDFLANCTAVRNLVEWGGHILEVRKYAERARSLIPANDYSIMSAVIELFPVYDLWLQGNLEQALEELNRLAKTIDTRSGEEQENFASRVGFWYICFGKLEAAEQIFQNLPEKARYLHLAEVAFYKGDRLKSRTYLLKHLDIPNPNPDPSAAVYAARIGLMSQAQEILTRIERQKRIHPNFIHMLQIEVAVAQGRTAQGILIARNDPFPGGAALYPVIAESLAAALERKGDLPSAVKVLETACQRRWAIWTGEPSLLNNEFKLAQLYRKLKRVEDAQKVEAELLHQLT